MRIRLYLAKRTLILFFSLSATIGPLKAQTNQPSPLIQLPREMKQEVIKQLIEVALSWEEAVKSIQALAATSKELHDLITNAEFEDSVAEELLNKFPTREGIAKRALEFNLDKMNGLKVAFLKRAGAELDPVLQLAAKRGYIETVRALLKHGADANQRSEFGIPLLLATVRDGHKDIVKLLLEHEADVNLTDPHGITSLMAAALRGNEDMVKLLLEYGADAAQKSVAGKTAFSLAEDYPAIQKLLQEPVQAGPEVKSGQPQQAAKRRVYRRGVPRRRIVRRRIVKRRGPRVRLYRTPKGRIIIVRPKKS